MTRRGDMPGIELGRVDSTLRADALAKLGITIEDMALRCNQCGVDFLLSPPGADGNFPPTWYVCPRGCNKPSGDYPIEPERLFVREA